MKFILYIYMASSICFFDSKTPDPSRFHDTSPRLTLSLNGFYPGAKVFIRFWEGNSAYAYPSDYALYVDAAGKLLTEIVLSQGAVSADALIYVDQSANGTLDAGDFGTYQAAISIDANAPFTYLDIPYAAGTLTAYNTLASIPSTGQKICMYMPGAKPAWNTALLSAIPKYPKMLNTSLTLLDWFPVSIISTTGIIQNVPVMTALGIGSFSEICVDDANSNGTYDSGETISSSVAVP